MSSGSKRKFFRQIAVAGVAFILVWCLCGYVKLPDGLTEALAKDGKKILLQSRASTIAGMVEEAKAPLESSGAMDSAEPEATQSDSIARTEPEVKQSESIVQHSNDVHDEGLSSPQANEEEDDKWCKSLPWSPKGSSLSSEEKAKVCRKVSAFVTFDYGTSPPRVFEDRMAGLRQGEHPLCDITVAVFNAHQGYCDGFGQLQSFLFSGKYKELNCMFHSGGTSKIVIPESGLTLIDGDSYLSSRKPLPKYDVSIACVRLTSEILKATAASARVSVPVVLRDMMSDSRRDLELLKRGVSVGTFLPDGVLTKGLVDTVFDGMRKPDQPKSDDESIAPVLYISSHCGVPFRDSFVKEFMKHIKVDSVGKCMNNKQQVSNKQGRYDDQTDAFVRQYKFMIAAENTDCSSYCSEKVWMPLARGVVPIVHGCSAIKAFAPKNSFIYSRDFASVAELAKHVKRISEDPAEYAKLVAWREKGGQSQGDEWQERFATQTWGSGGGYALHRMLREGKQRDAVFGAMLQAMTYVSPFVDLAKIIHSADRRPFISECSTENPNAARYFTKVCRGRNRDLPSLPPWKESHTKNLKCHSH